MISPEEDDLEFDDAADAAEDGLHAEGDDDTDDWFDDDDEDDDEDEAADLTDDDAFAPRADFADDEDANDADYADAHGGHPADGNPRPARPLPELAARTRAFIAEHQLLDLERDTVLVAVSGGRDSVVLLDVLHRLGARVAVAHAHFGLRAEEADADADFVRKLAKKLAVPFHLEHFATRQFAEKEQLSTQMAARTLRYAWFGKLAGAHGYAAVATAHHSADSAETMLLNLTRGTGLAGLHGIPVRGALAGSAAPVVRPLLFASPDDLSDYLVETQLSWREDASNEEKKYRRNRLRHDVLPVLRELNPNLDQTLQGSAERVRQAEALVTERVTQLRTEAVTVTAESVSIDVKALQNTPATALLLGELLRPYGFDYGQSRAIAGAFGGLSGTRFESATHRLVLDRGRLVLTAKDLRPFGTYALEAEAAELKLAGGRMLKVKHLALQPAHDYKPPRNPNTGAFDGAKLQFPLTVRPWAPGDWLVPLGMRGKQKVSDVLVNAKVPANLKDRVLVLVNGNGSLIWVIGQRIDDRFKVTADTAEVVEMAAV